MSGLVKPVTPNRSHIDLNAPDEMKVWSKRLGKSQDEIRAAVAKVGNSVAAVRKELGITDKQDVKEH